jgi:hypothetical protein
MLFGDDLVAGHGRASPAAPNVFIYVDKTKTRAETQMNMNLILDPMPIQFQFIAFPRYCLSKAKQLAGPTEIAANEEKGATLQLDLTLCLATSMDSPEKEQRALRRARGDEPTPRRPISTPVCDVDKDDGAHPQNGGAIIICDGCKERERKRSERKKKRDPDGPKEDEWNGYYDRRIIFINEPEYKPWQHVDSDHLHGPEAKKVDVQIRIACYCRHQEEKCPAGYKIIFTFRDPKGDVVVQKISDLLHVSDDHKNRETAAVESQPTDLIIYPPTHLDHMPPQYGTVFDWTAPYEIYSSQPTTPVVTHYTNTVSPMDTQLPNGLSPDGLPRNALSPLDTQFLANGLSQNCLSQNALSPLDTQSPPYSLSQNGLSQNGLSQNGLPQNSLFQDAFSPMDTPLPGDCLPQNGFPQNTLSRMQTQFSQIGLPFMMPRVSHQSNMIYGGGAVTAPTPSPAYTTHQRHQSYYNTPMMSPIEHFPTQAGYPLHRGTSLESFNMHFPNTHTPQSTYYPPFASQPPSRAQSRAASPSWENGTHRSKKMCGVPIPHYFIPDDDDTQ